MREIVNVRQGSAEWHQHRAAHFNASDAPAMLGISSYKSRTDLLHEKSTGFSPDVSAQTQVLFDNGHRYEAIARPWAEEIIGSELYPVVLKDEIEGLRLSVSVDGLTMLGDTVFEHKTLNQGLAESLDRGEIPAEYRPQIEQALLVSGAEKCLFMASDGNKETMRHAWYESSPKLRETLLAGWKQFEADLANYQHVEAVVIPEGRAPETLPALRIEVTGMVTASNLAEFKQTAMAVIGSVNTNLQTDQDFANAEKAVKWCGEVETRLDAAKEHALSQTASIDDLFRTLDAIKAEARAKRLDLEKLVTNRKQSIRSEIQQGAVNGLREHYIQINATLGRVALGVPADFGANVAAAMKGKKSVASLRDAADTTLAHAKIKASQDADRVRVNLQTLDANADHAHLFPDFTTLVVTKAPDDFKALTIARIAEHKAKEEQRLEAERARIRAEEQKKLDDERKAQEAKPIPTAPAAIQPSTGQAPTQAPAQVIARTQAPKATRPSDAQIIEVLAMHFRVGDSKVIEWLLDMDLDAESKKIAAGGM